MNNSLETLKTWAKTIINWVAGFFTLSLIVIFINYIYENNFKKSTLDKIESSIPAGEGYWLEQQSSIYDEWDKVAFVYGYIDDYEMCQLMIDGMQAKYYEIVLRCIPND